MGAASAKAYRSKAGSSKRKEEDVNTNIFLINFQFIKEKKFSSEKTILPSCAKCSAYFNKYSPINVITREQVLASSDNRSHLIPKDLVNNLLQKSEQSGIWFCDFCSTPMIVENTSLKIDSEFTLIEGHFPQKMEIEQIQEDVTKLASEGQQLIYVLDNSGSMASVEKYVKGGKQISLSRKKSVISAIQEQADSLKESTEETKDMSVVIFSDLVYIYTQIGAQPEVLSGSCLDNWDELLARVSGLSDKLEGVPPEGIEDIVDIYRKNNKMGSTALGPAVLAAVELAKTKKGTQVVVCTDGAANQGLGKFSGPQNGTPQFYNNLAQYASDKGVQISILGIGDEPIGLQQIGKLAEKTNGSVFKIDLSNLKERLENIVSDTIIASDLKLKLILHKSVELDKDTNTETQVEVGNATRETCLTFEYVFKEGQFDKQVPFQAVIEYTDLNNQRQLIIATKIVETTEERQQVENQIDMKVVEKHLAQKSANLAQNGQIQGANHLQQQWGNFVNNNNQYQAFAPQMQQQQCVFQQLASNPQQQSKNQQEQLHAQLQQMQKGKFY